MHRGVFTIGAALLAVTVFMSVAEASGKPPQLPPTKTVVPRPSGPTWTQHDTAVYVVSTLNLVRVRRNPLSAVLSNRYHVTHYDVYRDGDNGELFFIELRRSDGSILGALAYQMGWVKPRSLSGSTDHLGMRRAPRNIVAAYKISQKEEIGSFTSTLPA